MVWGNPPPPLAMPSSRRLSTSSATSSRSPSPVLATLDSSAALILVHDPEDSNTPFDFSSDDEGDDDGQSPQFDTRRASVPPLGPAVVFLYLLAPYLKLGAMLFPHTTLPLKYGLPPLFVFGVLSAFAKQILYMLARYMRTADIEDVVLDVFARGRGKERRRVVLRSILRGGTGTLRILLATAYLRESARVLLPVLPESSVLPTQPLLAIALALVVFPLTLAQSLASKRVIYSTWLSIASYMAWLGCVAYAHTRNTLQIEPDWVKMGALWQGTTVVAFAFTSSSTLPLYASLKWTTQPITTAKASKVRSFKGLSVISVAVAVLLTLPLVTISAHPNTSLSDPQLSSAIATAVLNALTLLLGIPALIVTTPSLPIPERIRHATTIPLSRTLLSILYTVLALVPTWASGLLSDILLVLALASTYFFPALVHITAHFFKRPLSIVIPQIPGTPLPGHSRQDSGPGSPRADELLLRKERALQKRQFRRRIIWDIGVWVLLLGSIAGGALAVGRVMGRI
ncbi:hypothetical protein BDZ94DRAFT_1183506 [Collybia nuda]|uniref:Uncharacterized protein n=1 Tax=Collybia nuda TaxID=64659 RepID=A0A9P5YIU9_9AGAR|nr:hypothetical protein BDZ94DRAFT_1183506 [Collybia nuda]